MKKTALIIAISLVVLSVIGLTATNVGEYLRYWSSFEKRDGVIQVQDGVLVRIPGEQDKTHLIQSIDPVTGEALEKLKLQTVAYKGKTMKLTSTMMKMTVNNKQVALNFDMAWDRERTVLLNNSYNDYHLTRMPNTNKTIMEYRNNLYMVDIDHKTMDKLLSDEVGKYRLQALEQSNYLNLKWGTDAHVSPDGSKLIFHSNRNAIVDYNLNGEMWLKDLNSGEEEPIAKGGYSVIGWGDNDHVYISRGWQIEEINVNTKESQLLFKSSLVAGLSYPYLIHQGEYGKLLVMNLKTGQNRDMQFDSLNVIDSIRTIDGSPWVILFNAPNRTEPQRYLTVMNMETGQVKSLEPPMGTFFTEGQWIDGGQFLVNVRERGSQREATYFIHLEEVID